MPQRAPTLAADGRPFQSPDVMAPHWQAILCDLDGCLISGEVALPGVQAFCRSIGERLWIVSNNSTDSPASLGARLRDLGLPIADERLILAGAEAVRALSQRAPAAPVALFASPTLIAYAERLGLEVSEQEPDTVLLCRDVGFDYAALRRILGLLEAGAELVVANPDVSHPSLAGTPVPETGALLAAIRSIRPRQRFHVIGKPEPHLFAIAMARAGTTADRALMIGDNEATDGAGADALGMAFLRVVPNLGLGHLLGDATC
ncbi:HAD-IIA family hydrolase [Halomonas faecis]|uniref:HAD-IIA family hydrolase n=1 Tax=Halomonas faecis TaxID=1562110 RepID=UPI001969D50B|nr:HAD hydrolase-like protein [Halomonas faecis]